MHDLIYIAGPFFTPEQKEVIRQIEDMLDERKTTYFSPREYGVIVDEDTPMNPARTKRIFDMNIRMIKEARRMIAVTDNFDPGAMFEIGAFHNEKGWSCAYGDDEDDTPIITYSPMGYGANVMIAHASFTHTRSIDELLLALDGHEIDQLWPIE